MSLNLSNLLIPATLGSDYGGVAVITSTCALIDRKDTERITLLRRKENPVEMVKVKQCDVSECAYNSQNQCHAIAITVGHGEDHPMCDTFFQSETKSSQQNMIAGVGACKISSCEYNDSLECCAPSISVGRQSEEVGCLTFKHR
jgi:hypothetical protein